MTREQLDALEKLYLERSDSLDASSYDIPELIAQARRALELEEALEWAIGNSTALYKMGRGLFCCSYSSRSFVGATPLEAIQKAQKGGAPKMTHEEIELTTLLFTVPIAWALVWAFVNIVMTTPKAPKEPQEPTA